jgi:outer membrane protein assembly factor BamB
LWQTAPPAEAPFYGAAASPLGERGAVITHPGDYGPLTAFDETTGAITWTAGSGGFFASPIRVDVDRVPQVVSVTLDSVIGVSLEGQILWRHPWKGGNGSITPVFSDGVVIVGSPDGVAGFRPARRDDGWTVEQIWETTDVTIYVSSPVAVDGVLYGLSTRQKGQLFAIDAKTGQVLWLGESRHADNTALVTAGDVLFLLNDDAELIVAKASRKGFEPIVRYAVADSATWAQPTISGNRIFIKDVMSLALWTID